MTLNDLERRHGRIVCVISPNSVAFGPYYANVVEDTPIHSASEMYPTEFSAVYHLWGCLQGITPQRDVKM